MTNSFLVFRKSFRISILAIMSLGAVATAAEIVNFDDAETGITSGTPDLQNESTGESSTVPGTFTDSSGFVQNYTASAMVATGATSYAAAGAGVPANSSDENRVEYEATPDVFRFRSGWDAGEGSTGEFRVQMLTVVFDNPHNAADFTLDVTSMNTAGEAFESAAVQFIDAGGALIGSASYNGFWDTLGTVVSSDVITNSSDVWTAEDTVATDVTDPDNPVAGSSGPNDNATISPVTDLGFAPTTQLTGYKITRWLEDVATVNGVADSGTSTVTNFTSSNSGAMVGVVPEPSSFGMIGIACLGLLGGFRRRR